MVVQFLSHSTVRALVSAMAAELVDLGGEVTGYSQGMCAIPPLSSTPMGGRNVAMLTSQQQSFLQNVISQIQQQIGHLDGIHAKSIANELTETGGANSLTMGGVSSLGGMTSGGASTAMPMMSGATSAVSGIGGIGNAGSSALNQVGSTAMSTTSSAVQSGTSGIGHNSNSNNSNGAHSGSGNHSNHGSHNSSHSETIHRSTFSVKPPASASSDSAVRSSEKPASVRVAKPA